MKGKTKEPPNTLQGQYAGFISRFMAYIIDVLVVIAVVTIVRVTVDIITRFFGLQQLVEQLAERLSTGDGFLGEALRLATLIGSVAFINTAYFVLMWNFTGGQSVGKALIGLRIVPLDGSKMSFLRSLVRFFAFLLSAIVLFIGLLWVLISDSRQGWHDKIARTCVIYDWPAREDDGVSGNVKTRWGHLKQARERFMHRTGTTKTKSGPESEIEPLPEETSVT